MRSLQTTVIVAIAMILSICIGCATMRGITPDKEVTIALAEFQAALKAQNLEKIMGFYSNDFIDSQGANKDMVRSTMENMASQGMLQNFSFVESEKRVITVNGDSATIKPLIIDSAMGKLIFNCTLKKEADGVWRLVSSEQIKS